jgi:large subunit ribosomal protein L11
MAKKIDGLYQAAGARRRCEPVAPDRPALGQRGVNIMEFCKAFNARPQEDEKGTPIPTIITVYADRSFTFEMKTPPASF